MESQPPSAADQGGSMIASLLLLAYYLLGACAVPTLRAGRGRRDGQPSSRPAVAVGRGAQDVGTASYAWWMLDRQPGARIMPEDALMRGPRPARITAEQLRAVGNPIVTDPEGLWRFLSLGTQRPTAAVLAAARPPDPSPEQF